MKRNVALWLAFFALVITSSLAGAKPTVKSDVVKVAEHQLLVTFQWRVSIVCTFKTFKIVSSDTTGSETVSWSNPEVGMWRKRMETRTAKHSAGPGKREIQLISYTVPK